MRQELSVSIQTRLSAMDGRMMFSYMQSDFLVSSILLKHALGKKRKKFRPFPSLKNI